MTCVRDKEGFVLLWYADFSFTFFTRERASAKMRMFSTVRGNPRPFSLEISGQKLVFPHN
jgi:hypothetical protein